MQFGENEFHIVRGDNAASQLGNCFGIPRDRMLIDNDDLACGPLAPYDNAATWQAARESFWWELPERSEIDDYDSAPGEFPARLETKKDRLASADTIYLWLGPLLSEILQLGFVLTVFDRLRINPARLRLVDLSPVRSSLGAEPPIGCLGSKHLEQIGPWRGLNDCLRSSYQDIWRAVTDPGPGDLIGIGGDSAYPALFGRAAKAYMARYPSTASGLGFWEQRTLDKCMDSRQKVAMVVVNVIDDSMGLADWPNHSWLFHRLKQVGDPGLRHPLVQIHGKGEQMRETEVNLTDAGRAVLAGEVNAIALNGIEDRIGGVTLTNENHWLFDGNTLIPAGTEG